jgi:hypothetical protein
VIVYRVFPHDASAAEKEPGGALFVPRSLGLWRIDNPDLYDAFYASSRPEGAIAETFGRFSVWRPETFSTAAGDALALARYKTLDDVTVVDLDDAQKLVSLRLKPSDVVSRDRTKTQLWARQIYLSKRGIGIGWWSYYDPDIHSFGLWDISSLAVDGDPASLSLDHPDIVATAQRINRALVSR